MRSLTPTTVQVAQLSSAPGSRAAQLVPDPESGSVYVAVERVDDDGVEVDIVRLASLDEGAEFSEVIASFSSPVLAPFPLKHGQPQTLDLHYFTDDQSLVVLLAGGDIAVLQLQDGAPQPEIEVVGSIDSGIKAAAWSPDEEQLILVTGEDILVCMTRAFDTIWEGPLRSDDFGDDKFINVGWGSKTTQFHGSLGKTALLAAQESARAPAPGPSHFAHATDDGLPRITFREEGSLFAVSSLDAYPGSAPEGSPGARRQVRVYARDASAGHAPRLSATSESIPGLEGALAWRPVGNVIAAPVRYGYAGGGEGRRGRWDIAMLERNGLRHGGFELREDDKTWEDGHVHAMAWNADSEVLAVWIRRADDDVVQLWTMKNYHYYLKQEIRPHGHGEAGETAHARRFSSIRWHAEQPMTLYVVSDDHVQVRTFVWDTYAARLPMPRDTATVAVVDGTRILVTPFRTQNTPPPMASYTLSLPDVAVHVAMSPSEDALAVLFASGLVQVWDLNTALPEKGASRLRAGGKPANPQLRWERNLAPIKGREYVAKQVCLAGTGEVGALFWGGGNGGAVLLTTTDAQDEHRSDSLLPCADHVLWAPGAGWLVVDTEGVLHSTAEGMTLVTLCPQPRAVAITSVGATEDAEDESTLVFALADTGRLFAASLDGRDSAPLAANVTSFTTTPDFLIYTTSAQRSFYAPLASVADVLAGHVAGEPSWESRRVERGALAVVACPSSMSLVLQMPRGNLETVYPRPLVLAVVRQDVAQGNYRSAFLTCRKHRLDLNVLYDLDPARFMAALPEFVRQIPEVDYLNLFVTSLNSEDVARTLYQDIAADVSRSPVPEDKVNTICDALRALVETDVVKYIETILTTYVCKQPADYEGGLRVLLQLRESHPAIVEEAIKYIIFLSNVNQLYDVALGMYDFTLVLMVAQYSQKDPKEYLPFLRELRALETNEQRFRIDDHLGRRESALRNLHAAGAERFDDAASYLSRYELWDEAFRLYADDEEHLPAVYELYGDYLYDRRDFHDSAIAYTLGHKPERALKAYEKAHAWCELFTLAREQDKSDQVIFGMVERVADYLASRGRHLEAAQVYVDYADDVDSAVDALCRGSEFAQAFRLVSRHNRRDLVESTIHPGLEEAQEALVETFEEMEGQLDKELKRLAQLMELRAQDPDSFYLVDNEPELENVDVATNATTVATAFTRYTVAPTVFSQSTRMTGQTNKSRHRPSRRRQAGRKGTVDEYDYLVASIGRLVARVDEKSAEALPLLRALVPASAEHRDLARTLQDVVRAFRSKLTAALDAAWADRSTILDTVVSSGGMGLGGNVDPARALERPEVKAWSGVAHLV